VPGRVSACTSVLPHNGIPRPWRSTSEAYVGLDFVDQRKTTVKGEGFQN